MDQHIEEFVNCKRIAVVGVSRNKQKFGNAAYAELKKRGYEVYAVHSSGDEIPGIQCYPDLKSISDKIDGVLISVSPSKVSDILQEISSLGIKNVWLQKGAESEDVLRSDTALNLHIVSGKCILMYAPPVTSVHAFHRFFVKLFGKL
ncbi:MAG: CoA-binding protein [Bacteroidota bacterium]